MNKRAFFVWISAGCLAMSLAACSPSPETPNNASAPAASASNSIAAEILNAATASQTAIDSNSAPIISEPLPMISSQPAPLNASASESLPPLPAECEQYYQRVDACFAQQGDDANELRQQNQEARLAAQREQPNQATCIALNQSFDALAAHLSCR